MVVQLAVGNVRGLQEADPTLIADAEVMQVAAFTVSVFVEDSQQAATGTEEGDIIMWEPCPVNPKATASAARKNPFPGMLLAGDPDAR